MLTCHSYNGFDYKKIVRVGFNFYEKEVHVAFLEHKLFFIERHESLSLQVLLETFEPYRLRSFDEKISINNVSITFEKNIYRTLNDNELDQLLPLRVPCRSFRTGADNAQIIDNLFSNYDVFLIPSELRNDFFSLLQNENFLRFSNYEFHKLANEKVVIYDAFARSVFVEGTIDVDRPGIRKACANVSFKEFLSLAQKYKNSHVPSTSSLDANDWVEIFDVSHSELVDFVADVNKKIQQKTSKLENRKKEDKNMDVVAKKVDSVVSTVKSSADLMKKTVKSDVENAVWRQSVEAAVDLAAKQVAKNLPKLVTPARAKMLVAFLSTPAGRHALAYAAGVALTLSPKKNAKLDRLAEELRIFGVEFVVGSAMKYVAEFAALCETAVKNVPDFDDA